MFGLAAIINVAGVLFAAGVALRFRSLQATPLMQVPVFLFLFLAPVYVPRELLTGWVEAVSGFDPATHVMEAGRELLAGQPADVLGALAIAVGLVVVLGVFAITGMRTAEAAG
jgi:ABC-2 type transport system permease protein